MLGKVDRIIGPVLATKTVLEVPADPKWRHVVAATVLAAVRAALQLDLGQLGDLSLLLDRALDDVSDLAGVTRLRIGVDSDGGSVLVTVVGEGGAIEPPTLPDPRTDDGLGSRIVDPLTGLTIEWTQNTVTGSFRFP